MSNGHHTIRAVRDGDDLCIEKKTGTDWAPVDWIHLHGGDPDAALTGMGYQPGEWWTTPDGWDYAPLRRIKVVA